MRARAVLSKVDARLWSVWSAGWSCCVSLCALDGCLVAAALGNLASSEMCEKIERERAGGLVAWVEPAGAGGYKGADCEDGDHIIAWEADEMRGSSSPLSECLGFYQRHALIVSVTLTAVGMAGWTHFQSSFVQYGTY